MPHYYFDIHDGIHITDSLGQTLPDLEAAKTEATRIASGFAARTAMLGSDGGALNVITWTAPGVVVMKVRLVFNIEIPR